MYEFVKQHTLNTMGRDFVVGDIHGYFSLLSQKLIAIKFNPYIDRLFSVGDLINRGVESNQVLDWLNKAWFFPVLGNHEILLKKYYLKECGEVLLNKAGGQWFSFLDELNKKEIITAFSKIPYVREVNTYQGKVGIVHSECPTRDWEDFVGDIELYAEASICQRIRISQARQNIHEKISNIDSVICGHSIVPDILVSANSYFIDTGAYKTQKLTLVQINNKNHNVLKV